MTNHIIIYMVQKTQTYSMLCLLLRNITTNKDILNNILPKQIFLQFFFKCGHLLFMLRQSIRVLCNMGHYWYMLTKTKITVVQNEFKVKAQSSLQLNLLFTLVKLKTTGHGGEVYKGLLRKGEGSLSYLVVGWFMPK